MLERVVLLLSCALVWAQVARAHDPGISTAQATVRAGGLEIVTGFAPADIEQLLPQDLRVDRSWTQADFDAARDQLVALAPQIWQLQVRTRDVPPDATAVELLPGDNVSFRHVFPLGAGERFTLRAVKVPDLPPGHRQFLIVSDEAGSTITKKLLSAADYALEVPAPAPEPAAASARGAAEAGDDTGTTFWAFLKLGVEHIWTGYDHLMFLFALLIVCRSFRSIAVVITCFTIAHSLTLALATLDVVRLPARWVEAAIAASIVFVGLENLWRRGEEPRGRWALTFAFGLIHGFGFASVLRDLGVGQGSEGIALPLFTFNLGVELGQIAIAAAVLPLVWWLRKREAFVQRGVPLLSALVAVAGLYWLVERTVFG